MVSGRSRNRARLVFAANLRRVRTDVGLSQEALAAKAKLHRTYVGSVERGERNISMHTRIQVTEDRQTEERNRPPVRLITSAPSRP
ncbi:MAG: helix-turn-helix transcriptional regulator [Planctomycetota bacterium]